MDRRNVIMLVAVTIGWLAYFGGLDNVPGWNGFGKGMFVGSFAVLAIVIGRTFQRRRSRHH
ncbi:MAG TPA: hypothetical protein VIL65_05660 [Beijerinckiaceae bacterium]|jgi:hypothetical protein